MPEPMDPRRRAALGLRGRGSRPPDPRHIVTPDAFEVDPSLLGIPLASHSRRLAAIGVDVLLVAILTQAGGLLLGILAAVFFLRLALGGGKGSAPRTTESLADGPGGRGGRGGEGVPGASLFRGALGCMGAVILLLTVLAAWGILSGGPEARPSPDPVAAPDVSAILEESMRGIPPVEGEPRPALPPAGPASPNEGRMAGIRGFLRTLAEDLGLGFGWGALYFSAFLAWGKGQTPGKRFLRIRVVRLDARPITLWGAFERYGGYAAGFATGLLGFAQVFWDANRQAIHDKITGTVVIRDGAQPLAEPTRRLRSRDLSPLEPRDPS